MSLYICSIEIGAWNFGSRCLENHGKSLPSNCICNCMECTKSMLLLQWFAALGRGFVFVILVTGNVIQLLRHRIVQSTRGYSINGTH